MDLEGKILWNKDVAAYKSVQGFSASPALYKSTVIVATDGTKGEGPTRLTALHRQREQNSVTFFRDNARKFLQQQDLIASYEQYADTVAQVLRDASLQRRHTALEVGPGDGSFFL